MAVRQARGFTIVELLIVIVVIAILAAIVIVAYNGVQAKARDSTRSDLVGKIQQALELYKIDNGRYPAATANPGVGGWESSTDTTGTFMEYLKPYGLPTPVDPKNDTTYRILYFRYSAGGSAGAGCDVSKGPFYVLRVVFENAANKPTGNSMTADCTTPQASWNDGTTNYAFHSYE